LRAVATAPGSVMSGHWHAIELVRYSRWSRVVATAPGSVMSGHWHAIELVRYSRWLRAVATAPGSVMSGYSVYYVYFPVSLSEFV
jgi:hypothetical protein